MQGTHQLCTAPCVVKLGLVPGSPRSFGLSNHLKCLTPRAWESLHHPPSPPPTSTLVEEIKGRWMLVFIPARTASTTSSPYSFPSRGGKWVIPKEGVANPQSSQFRNESKLSSKNRGEKATSGMLDLPSPLGHTAIFFLNELSQISPVYPCLHVLLSSFFFFVLPFFPQRRGKMEISKQMTTYSICNLLQCYNEIMTGLQLERCFQISSWCHSPACEAGKSLPHCVSLFSCP